MLAKVDNGLVEQERVSRPISRGSQLGGSQFERAQLGEAGEGGGEGGGAGQRLTMVDERSKAAERGRAGARSTGAVPTASERNGAI